jgi:hypothetical protein
MFGAVAVASVVLAILAKVLNAISRRLRGERKVVIEQREECWGGE